MSIQVLCAGSLFRDPAVRMSKSNKPFVAATIVSKDGDASTFVNIIVFDARAQDEIQLCRSGDNLVVQGRATLSVYEKNGEHRPSISIVADQVLSLRRQKPKAGGSYYPPALDERSKPAALAFNDTLEGAF